MAGNCALDYLVLDLIVTGVMAWYGLHEGMMGRESDSFFEVLSLELFLGTSYYVAIWISH